MPAKPVDVYVRVSRVGGRENLISPDEQEQRARALARERGLRVGEVLTDLDESGGKWERPGLQAALDRVRRGRSGGLIVAWLDRLSRDSEHAHRLVREIHEAGGAIYAPDAPTDWTTPEGELQVGIVFVFAQYVRQRARAGFERAKQRAIESGIPVHSRAPVGYRARPDRRLELDPATAPAVREVFARRAGGAGPAALADYLQAQGVTTSQGSAAWSKQAVYGLLRSRVYLGELHYGRDGRYANLAAHEPLVDLVTWQLAQSSARRPRTRRPGSTWLLTGLLRCGACRYALQGTTDSHGHRIYRCTRRHAAGTCPEPVRLRAEPLEAAVVADLRAHLPDLRARGKRDERGRIAELAEAAERERAALRDWASPEVQAEIGDLDLYLTGLRERRQRVTAAEAVLEAEQQLAVTGDALPGEISLREAWDVMTTADRAALLALRYECLALRRNPARLVVFPAGVSPGDLPTRGYRRAPVLAGFPDDLPSGARVLPL